MEFLADLHPQIIHFPIAILILYSIIEILGIILKNEFLQKTAHLLLAIGVVAAVAAVLTGNQAAEVAKSQVPQNLLPEEAIENHESYATYTLWYFLGLLVLRTYLVLKKKFENILKYIFVPLVLIGIFLIYKTGDLGGELVYDHGVGTNPVEQLDSE